MDKIVLTSKKQIEVNHELTLPAYLKDNINRFYAILSPEEHIIIFNISLVKTISYHTIMPSIDMADVVHITEEEFMEELKKCQENIQAVLSDKVIA